MKAVTRRLFASLMPAAPLAAGEAARVTADTLLSKGSNPIGPISEGLDSVLQSAAIPIKPLPPNVNLYRQAESAYDRASYLEYQIREHADSHRQNMNIRALRSVSPVFKAHMQMRLDEENRRARLSFLEKLKDSLGLRRWFDSHEQLEDVKYNPNSTGF